MTQPEDNHINAAIIEKECNNLLETSFSNTNNEFDLFIIKNNVSYNPLNKSQNNFLINKLIQNCTSEGRISKMTTQETCINRRSTILRSINKLEHYNFSKSKKEKIDYLVFKKFNNYLLKFSQEENEQSTLKLSNVLKVFGGKTDPELFCYIFSFESISNHYKDFIARYLKVISRNIIKKLKINQAIDCYKVQHYLECLSLIYK